MKRIFLMVCLLAIISDAVAQSYRPSSKDKGWELTIIVEDQGSESISGPADAAVDFSSNTGWGIGFGYNFNSKLNLAFDMTFSDPKYKAVFRDADGDLRSISHRSDFFTGNLNLNYYFMDGITFESTRIHIKPLVRIGVGWTNIDSNVSDGNGYCVPDYYWGWYCYNSSYNENNLSYNAAVGLKVDFSNDMFLRGSYGRQWIDISGASDAEFDTLRLELGFKY